MLLGLQPENVRVIFTRGSGCYGINGADTVSYDAALLSQAVGKPVRVQLSRKDEMAWENYGLAYVIDQRVGLDANGTIVAWDYESWSPRSAAGPATTSRATSSPACSPGSSRRRSRRGRRRRRRPGASTTAATPCRRTSPAASAAAAAARARSASERVLTHTFDRRSSPARCARRARLQNTFAHESFMDEIAARVKADPVAYRLRHLRDPRLIDVVARRREGGELGGASVAASRTRAGPASPAGRGVACVLYEGDNGYCALVAEVEVNQETGRSRREAPRRRRRTAVRSRIPTACGISSKAARCRA